jgi:hypothetical protein
VADEAVLCNLNSGKKEKGIKSAVTTLGKQRERERLEGSDKKTLVE